MWGDISPSPPGEIKALATHPRIAAGDALNNSSQKAFSLKIKASSHPHNASHRRPQITVSKSPTASENQPLRFKQFPVLQARNVTSPRASSEPQPHPTSWRGPQTPLPHWVPTSQPSQPAQAGSSPSTLQLMSNNATIDSREEGKASENRRHTLIRAQECDLVRGSCAQRAATRALPGPASPVRPGRLGDPPTALPSLLGLARRVRSAAHRRRHVQRGALRGAEQQPARDAGVLAGSPPPPGGRGRPAPRGCEPRIF